MDGRYAYRKTIDVSHDPDFDDRGKAIIHAAFAVAQRAHAGQSRGKIDPDHDGNEIMYISHPIMVFDIMRRLGETDPVVLAAAILHDAIEDHSVFRANDVELGDALFKELCARGIEEESVAPLNRPVHEDDLNGDAFRITDGVMDLCREVTNPEVFGGDGIKEHYQIDRVNSMSFHAKKIKIADQAASLICNLTMANDPATFTPTQEKAFSEKAHALVVAIFQSVQGNTDEHTLLKPWASFFGKTMLNVLPLLQTENEKQKEEIRETFSFDRLFDSATYIDILPSRESVVERVYMPRLNGGAMQRQGLSWVEYGASGNVVRYALWTDWEDADGKANTIQKNMTKTLRAVVKSSSGGSQQLADNQSLVRTLVMPGNLVGASSKDGTPIDGLERVFTLSPSLGAGAFASAAHKAGAIRTVVQNLFITINGARVARESALLDAQKPKKPDSTGITLGYLQQERLRGLANRMNDSGGFPARG